MLRRQISGGFVCLRCRLQGASTANRPGAPLFRSVASRDSGPLSSIYFQRFAQDRSKRFYSAANAATRHEEAPDEVDDPIGDLLLGLDPKSDTSPRIRHPQASFGKSLEETGDELHIDDQLWLNSEAQRLASLRKLLPEPNSSEARPFDPNSDVPRFNSALLSSLKMYQSRGERVAAKKEDLIIDILGSPGSALVMRGAGQWKKKGQLTRMEATCNDMKAENLIRHLEREVNNPEIDEILRNIHELQPADKQISPDQFHAAAKVLAKGFTARQLATYVANYREADRNDAHPSRLPTDPPWILERLPWIAAVDKPDANLAPILYRYISKSMSRKEKLAVQIMRECWGISSYDVLDQDGLLMVKLRKEELSLLMLGSHRWLTTIAKKSMDPGTQITVYPPIHTIAILAPHKTGEQTLAEINKILERSKTVSFDASLLSANALDPAVLEEVGRITNTVVRLNPSGDKILITWIHVASRPDEYENLGHVVLRYLLYAADTGPRSSAALIVVPNDNARGGRYVVEQDCEQKMTWMDRLRKWTRWVKAADTFVFMPEPCEIPASLLAHPLEVQSKREMGDEASRSEQALGPAGWSSTVKTDTRAVFGRVLHAQQGANSPLISPTTDFDNSRQHTFLPVNPPLQSLTFPTNFLETGLYHAILVMRFVPAPTQRSAAPALAATAPPLELRIEIDHREVKRIISVRLVTGTHTGDVMLPSYPVDARLVQTSYVELEGRFVDKHAPPVLDFLNQSDIRPWDGKLENPPSLDGIQVPSSLFLRKDTATAGEQDTADPSNAVDDVAAQEETVQIDYLFASREIQRVITGEHDGYRVSYWTMDGGQRGGQSDQLVLDAIAPTEPTESPQGELEDVLNAITPRGTPEEEFLKAVSKIASGSKYFLWQRDSPDKYLQNL